MALPESGFVFCNRVDLDSDDKSWPSVAEINSERRIFRAEIGL